MSISRSENDTSDDRTGGAQRQRISIWTNDGAKITGIAETFERGLGGAMFFWSHRRTDTYVVLSDDEEMSLVAELCNRDPVEYLRYDHNKETRKKYEKKIFEFLEQSLKSDYEAFSKKYVFRSLYGDDVHEFFQGYLRRYGALTRLATLGTYTKSKRTHVIEFVGDEDDELYYISWMYKKPLFLGYTYDQYISFPAKSIKKMVGRVTNFTIMTDKFQLNFNTDCVRLTVL